MSFSDRPGYGSWQRLGCLALVCALMLGNVLFFANWYLTFWDLSTGEYRSLALGDSVVPAVWLASLVLLRLYVRFILRDRD